MGRAHTKPTRHLRVAPHVPLDRTTLQRVKQYAPFVSLGHTVRLQDYWQCQRFAVSESTHLQPRQRAQTVVQACTVGLLALYSRHAPAHAQAANLRLQARSAARLATLVCMPAQARGRARAVPQVNMRQQDQADAAVA